MKFYIKFLLLICVLLAGASFNSVWGQAPVNTVLWSEDFSGYANNSNPSGSITNSHTGTTVYGGVTLTYSKTNGGTTTQTYASGGPNSNSNLLISKGNGTFTVSGISTGDATELTVTYAKSGDGILAISSSTIGVTISGSASGSTITTDGVSTINLTFKNTTGSSGANLRIDDIVVKVKTAAVVKTNVGSFSSVSDQAVTKGGNIDFDPSEYYTDDAGVTGTTTFTVTPTSGDIYYSGGRIYATAYGSQVFTVTATPAAADEASYKSVSTSFTVNCADPRTAVNILSFSATNTTLIVGGSPNTTTTSVTNDQPGWTAAYTYTSSDESVATVANDGKITAIGKGTATITATLNVADNDATYKAGATASKTLEITVNKHSHTVTFSVNGNTDLTASVEEDQKITFPTAVETTPGENEFAKVINGQTFVGWYTGEYSNASVAPSYVNTASTNMGDGDVTYYAVYADEEEEESDDMADAVIGQTLQYDTWTYSGTTKNMTTYRLFGENAYIESASFDLSKLMKVQVYAGTYGTLASGKKKVTIMAGDTEYGIASLTTNKEGTQYVVTSEAILSGNGKVSVIAAGGDADNNGIRISKVELFVKGTVTNRSNFTTDNRASAGIAFTNASVDVKLTSGYAGQALTNPNSLGVTYSSTDETVATVNSLTGVITELLKAGSTTITASYPGNATYKPAVASYDLNVTEKIPHGLAYAVTEVEKLTTDAAFTNTLTNGNSLAVSYSSSATGVATVNSSTGEVTIKGAGETTITASFAGDEDYEAGNASYTLTVSKATPTLAFASANATGREGKPFAGNALSNPASLTVAYSSSDEDVATVDEETGEISIVAGGTTTITASFAGNDTYLAANPSYTLKVLFAPTFTLSDQSVNYGKTYTVDEGDITGGTITVTSGNTAIATVDGLVITSAAVGTVEITVSTAEDETYDAGSASFNLTVNAPTGKTSTPGGKTTTFTDKDLHYSSGGVVWTASKSANSFESASPSRGVQFGAAIGEFTLSTSAITGVITRISMSVSTNGTANNNTISVKVGETDFKNNGNKTFSMPKANGQTVEFSREGSGTIVISCNNKASSIYFKSITVYTKTNADVTIPSSGFGTFCYQYPLDLDLLDENAKAYIVTSVEGNNVTLKRITGTIKGGVPFILYGSNEEHTLYTAESSSTVPAGNMLVGTLAPTYITATNGDYTNFGMKSGKFVKAANGVMPANKAYLPVLTSILGGGAREFNFIFDDDTTTGIRQTENLELRTENAVYDLQGRKVAQPTRGGLYIVNGRKVVIK